MKTQEFKIVKEREDSLLIDDGNGTVAIAKHEDENGAYFLDRQLNKKYLSDTVYLNKYTFKTDLYDKDQIWHTETKSFLAENLNEAMKNQRRYYGAGFDRMLLKAENWKGEPIEV